MAWGLQINPATVRDDNAPAWIADPVPALQLVERAGYCNCLGFDWAEGDMVVDDLTLIQESDSEVCGAH